MLVMQMQKTEKRSQLKMVLVHVLILVTMVNADVSLRLEIRGKRKELLRKFNRRPHHANLQVMLGNIQAAGEDQDPPGDVTALPSCAAHGMPEWICHLQRMCSVLSFRIRNQFRV
jgi:hypothetical protein